MSVAVPLDGLRAAIAERGGGAYLLTVSDDGRPHTVHVPVRWDGDALAASAGKTSARNAMTRSAVALIFPVRDGGDYSLIVDGTAAASDVAEGRVLRITPTKAVLHRAAAIPNPESSCEADCVPILPSTTRSAS
ncbi:MAG: pyridoxamine 5'-phosphate oxidase family protein [Deltaproteobacteria bacterium]|nr:pyridoxamine 5'-phosphate oxidase family protein [Deltaproteobacteria bacterium]